MLIGICLQPQFKLNHIQELNGNVNVLTFSVNPILNGTQPWNEHNNSRVTPVSPKHYVNTAKEKTRGTPRFQSLDFRTATLG